MTLECPECGRTEQSRKWTDCGHGHRTAAMYQVISWGKYPKPVIEKIDCKTPPENKGFPEEKNETLAFI